MAETLKFGTSGLRGLATALAGKAAIRYCTALLEHFGQTNQLGPTGTVLIGRDLRASSPAIAVDAINAVVAAGLAARDCGEVPTPALALLALTLEAPAIMVTGSHIPADRNGLKFYSPYGEITKSDEAGILECLESVDGEASSEAHAAPAPEALADYLDRCRLLLHPDALDGLRIGVWQHSSVFRDGLPDLLTEFGAECILLGREAGFLAVDTEAISADVAAQIAGWVKAHRLDALVSTDGDADRPLVADETGALVRGDVLGILSARYLGIGAVVTPVTSTSTVETSRYFQTVIRTRVGSPFVLADMERARLSSERVMGFEANGGVLLGTSVRLGGQIIPALPTRDAMLPILSVLGLARQAGVPLSVLVSSLPPRFTRSDRLENVPTAQSALLIERLGAEFFAEIGEMAARNDIDGVRITLSSGDVIHFRPSGNAPELRCYTEADTAERADALLDWGLRAASAVVRNA